MTGNRISWSPFGDGHNANVSYGQVPAGGTVFFRIVRGRRVAAHPAYFMTCDLPMPGIEDRDAMHDDPDWLKAKAEEWLAEFVTALGAVFPDQVRADERRRCAGIIRRAAACLAGDDQQMRAYRESAMTMADLIDAPRCGECSGVHPANPGSDGDSCAGHGHRYIPRDHPDGLDPGYETWWGCPECGNGRWFS